MYGKERHRLAAFRLDHLVVVLVIVFLGSLVSVSQAEAVLTAQSISGTVEVLLAGEQTWKPLTAAMKLKTGDQIRTGRNSSVDLWFEDGSVLNLAEETQLAISQLEISTTRKSRIARFKLWWGAVTAKVTKLAFTENVCEVETDTVVAGVKFSEMTVIHPQNASQSEVIARRGLIDIERISNTREVKVSGLLNEQEGLEFLLPPSVGVKALIGVREIIGEITLWCSEPLRAVRVLMDSANTLLKVDNTSSKAPINVGVEGTIAVLGQQASAVFGVPPGQELTIETIEETDVSVSIKRRTAILCDGLYIFLNKGDLNVNGQSVKGGVPNCFPVAKEQLIRGRALIQKEEEARALAEEQPVAPGAPGAQMPRGADAPTPIPTATPTPTPEPEEEEEEEPTPTPTPTPKPKPKPTPGCPACPPPPSPAPTETPASPSEIIVP